MPIPTTQFYWATEDITESILVEGLPVDADNKAQPPTGLIEDGVRARQPLARPYLNYPLNSHGLWIEYLREGDVGDYKFMPTTTTVMNVQERFGGTWVDRGITTVSGGTSLRLFEKTF